MKLGLHISEFIHCRMEEAGELVIYTHPQYQKNDEHLNKVIDDILLRLGEDPINSKVSGTGDTLLNAISEIALCHEEAGYLKGFKDALEFKNLFTTSSLKKVV